MQGKQVGVVLGIELQKVTNFGPKRRHAIKYVSGVMKMGQMLTGNMLYVWVVRQSFGGSCLRAVCRGSASWPRNAPGHSITSFDSPVGDQLEQS